MDKHVSILSVPGNGFLLPLFPVHKGTERLPYALVPLAASGAYGTHLLQAIRLHDLCSHIFHMPCICHEYDFIYHRRGFKHLQRIGHQRLSMYCFAVFPPMRLPFPAARTTAVQYFFSIADLLFRPSRTGVHLFLTSPPTVRSDPIFKFQTGSSVHPASDWEWHSNPTRIYFPLNIHSRQPSRSWLHCPYRK